MEEVKKFYCVSCEEVEVYDKDEECYLCEFPEEHLTCALNDEMEHVKKNIKAILRELNKDKYFSAQYVNDKKELLIHAIDRAKIFAIEKDMRSDRAKIFAIEKNMRNWSD